MNNPPLIFISLTNNTNAGNIALVILVHDMDGPCFQSGMFGTIIRLPENKMRCGWIWYGWASKKKLRKS